jgi:hypothetical protein
VTTEGFHSRSTTTFIDHFRMCNRLLGHNEGQPQILRCGSG